LRDRIEIKDAGMARRMDRAFLRPVGGRRRFPARATSHLDLRGARTCPPQLLARCEPPAATSRGHPSGTLPVHDRPGPEEPQAEDRGRSTMTAVSATEEECELEVAAGRGQTGPIGYRCAVDHRREAVGRPGPGARARHPAAGAALLRG